MRPPPQSCPASGVIGNLADLGAVLLRLDDGPLRKQAPYGHRQLPILPDIVLLSGPALGLASGIQWWMVSSSQLSSGCFLGAIPAGIRHLYRDPCLLRLLPVVSRQR